MIQPDDLPLLTGKARHLAAMEGIYQALLGHDACCTITMRVPGETSTRTFTVPAAGVADLVRAELIDLSRELRAAGVNVTEYVAKVVPT